MLGAIFLLLAVLAALAVGAPPPSLLAPREDICVGDPYAETNCLVIEYRDRTSGSSPPAGRCQEACQSILTDPDVWIIDFNGMPAGYRDVLVLGSCIFSVGRAKDTDTSGFSITISNQDIVGVIEQAIVQFAGKHGGFIAAEVLMQCEVTKIVRFFIGEGI
ncbi:hypothetical protein GGS26DRAFT_588378 [Hypomontagnella submonticulosa]|nr:hypothetical protein GGS26DRAFT_588378 [Hypomontagnella submonticulosa]